MPVVGSMLRSSVLAITAGPSTSSTGEHLGCPSACLTDVWARPTKRYRS
jgi:hypothetical protein